MATDKPLTKYEQASGFSMHYAEPTCLLLVMLAYLLRPGCTPAGFGAITETSTITVTRARTLAASDAVGASAGSDTTGISTDLFTVVQHTTSSFLHDLLEPLIRVLITINKKLFKQVT